MPEIEMPGSSSFESAMAAILTRYPNITGYTEPWWGDKQTASGNMANRGFVIGFRDPLNRAQYRLDYDPIKKLHINWTQDLPGTATKKECYPIQSIRPQDTMWDYYTSWTKSRSDDIPADIHGRLGKDKRFNGRWWSG